MNEDVVAVAGAVFLSVMSFITGALGTAYALYIYAPPVGGEFWPYILGTLMLIGGIIGGTVALTLFKLMALFLLMYIASRT